ncbi:signal recognition particle 19 kDa protein isoform X1 [Ornithorhynchus anatinus]|uniref:Signal recognition particle 19 kDa protein n=1 Tax=Ornithorhynchus anatinus TaxID=9258 RepID=A0A6I8NW72_ORNAN|nr:signal recognition particle 19 kDa protein isoform X1 [Ornithorhynchus anatinus]
MRRMRRRFGRRVFCTLATSASPTRRKDSGGTMAYDEMSPADKDRFICIYPAYLNNKKTIAEGRRIPVEKAVENPTSTEIQDVCAAVGLNVLVEKNKMYSREWNRDMQYRGRVRIQLKRDDGSLCFPQFPSRKSVMLYAAEMIPKLKTRTQKSGSGDHNYQLGDGGKKGKGKKKK